MKKTLQIVKLLLLLILTIQLASAENLNQTKLQKMNESNTKIISFFDVNKTDHLTNDMTAFSAVLTIAEIQSVSNGGIDFGLSLQYEGANRIEIHNPIYFFQTILSGRDKTQLFNGGKPPIPLINRKGPINEATDFNFNILAIKKNGDSLNIHEQINLPSIPFQKGDEQSYYLQISKYLNQQTKQLEDIPQGIYHLEILFSIIGADSTEGDLQNRTLKVQDISVSFR